MSSLRHLAGRFAGSLWLGGPGGGAEQWVAGVLAPPEQELWRRMSGPDRRHAVGVARRAEQALGKDVARPVLAAALLHDVGKIEAGLGTFSRVLATIAGRGRRQRLPARYRAYLEHDERGARLLSAAGSDPLPVAWAREHHLPPDRWTLPPDVAAALKAADGD